MIQNILNQEDALAYLSRSLWEGGIIPSTDLGESEYDFPFAVAVIIYVVGDYEGSDEEKMRMMNDCIWRLTRLLGEISEKLLTMDWDEVSEHGLEDLVDNAANKLHFDNKSIILAIQSCIIYWVRTSSIHSVGHQFSNLLRVLACIASAVNSID